MAKHKITMRDIAQECHVSVATVSYVLNHSEKEKISHETRLKILQAATRLHYVPSEAIKSGLNRNSNLVGIIINLKGNDMSGKKLLYYDLASELSQQLKLLKFDSIVITTQNLEKDVNLITKHSLDAVFMIDVDNTSVQHITQGYYVPIIFLDCEVNDHLFCQIMPDYGHLIQKAHKLLGDEHPFLMIEDICSHILKEQITKWFLTKDIFINASGADLNTFLKSHKGQNGVIIGDLLALYAECRSEDNHFAVISSLQDSPFFLPETVMLPVSNKRKAKEATEVLRKMLDLSYTTENNNRILLDCNFI